MPRTARPSAQLYSEIARSHTLSSDMVSRYAPEYGNTVRRNNGH